MKKLYILLCLPFLVISRSEAVVVYANCPTLSPLPITNFMPGAMLPINNVQLSYDAGTTLIAQTISTVTQLQVENISGAFNSVMKNMIEVSQTTKQQEMEIERLYKDMKMSYEMELEKQKIELGDALFAGDQTMTRPKPGEVRVINPNSPTYKFVKQVCTASKMEKMSNSVEVIRKAQRQKTRRSQKIISNIQAVSSISAAAKQNVDLHFDIFCTESEMKAGLCDSASFSPNADLEAFNFLYPVGYREDGDTVQTLYTYSPVESLAAYQYIKNITGILYVVPPTIAEMEDINKAKFLAAYNQMVSALSVSTESLLSISKNRSSVNNTGIVMSRLDVINYMINQSNLPENKRIVDSASDQGKMIEVQKQLALSQQLRLLILKQRDKQRVLKAAELSIDNTGYIN